METSEPIRRTSEIEEITNHYVIHPISSFLTPIFARLGVTPNAVSIAGMTFGAMAGVAYYRYRDPRWAFAGFILMIAWHVMDGADGQLARLTHAQSQTGKILDGICDYVTFIAVYAGLGNALSADLGGWTWVLIIAAGLCHSGQSAAYELQRHEYNFWGWDRKASELGTLTPFGGGERAPRVMEMIYRLYVSGQLRFAILINQFRARLAAMLRTAEPERAAFIRRRYREVFAPAVRRWSILSANYRTIGIFAGALAGVPQYYLAFEIIGFSAILGLLILYQRSRYRLLFDSLADSD